MELIILIIYHTWTLKDIPMRIHWDIASNVPVYGSTVHTSIRCHLLNLWCDLKSDKFLQNTLRNYGIYYNHQQYWDGWYFIPGTQVWRILVWLHCMLHILYDHDIDIKMSTFTSILGKVFWLIIWVIDFSMETYIISSLTAERLITTLHVQCFVKYRY